MHARTDEVRFIEADAKLSRADVTPSGRRRAAAAAFQRQNEVEHTASVAAAGDTSTSTSPKPNSSSEMRVGPDSGEQPSKYAKTVREDHQHFVEAFREDRIPGVSSS